MNYGTDYVIVDKKGIKMSTSPYSLDLRKKVIEFIDAGNSQREASKVFSISKTTINTWYIRYKKDGNYAPKKRLGARPQIDRSKFIRYVEDNPNATTSEIGKNFGITHAGAHYWLRKLGFGYKKKTLPMWKRTKRSAKNI